jgi:hypothetical protein
LTIKTAGVSLVNKEAQLFATPLEKREELEFASPMNPNSSTKDQQKIKRG